VADKPRKQQNGRVTAKKERPEPQDHLPRLSVEDLLTPSLPEDILDIPSLGGSVVIRAFNGKVAKEAREWASPKDEKGEPIIGADMDDDQYEKALVLFGVIEPKLSEDDVNFIFDEQFSFVGRMIALSVLSLNASGKALDLAKGSGQSQNVSSAFG
jgi:hypothetical protein